MSYYVRAVDQQRAEFWQKLFGKNTLPVKTDEPRWQVVDAGRPETLAYDLDVDRLHWMQRERLIRHMAEVGSIPVEEARRIVETASLPIRARGVELVEKAPEEQ